MADADSVYEGLADAKNMMPPHPSFARLPAELRRLVVSYLVQHRIVQHWCIASTVKLRPIKARIIKVDLSSNIWASLVKIHNRRPS